MTGGIARTALWQNIATSKGLATCVSLAIAAVRRLAAKFEAPVCPNVAARGPALIAGLAHRHGLEADLPTLAPLVVRVAGPRVDAALRPAIRALSRTLSAQRDGFAVAR